MDKFEYQKKISEFLPGSSKNFYSVIVTKYLNGCATADVYSLSCN